MSLVAGCARDGAVNFRTDCGACERINIGPNAGRTGTRYQMVSGRAPFKASSAARNIRRSKFAQRAASAAAAHNAAGRRRLQAVVGGRATP